MTESVRVTPPYSIVFIEDPTGGELPELAEGCRLAATNSCVAVGTQCEVDGETEFHLGARGDVDPGTQPAFRGKIDTPSKKLAIRSVPDEVVLQVPVRQTETMVSIWVNDPIVPDVIIVGVE